MTVNTAIERVSTADGAAGWCTMIAATTTSIACLLPPDGAKEVFGDPAGVAGGAFAPTGTAMTDGDALRLTGRWSWGSGTDHSDWVSAGVITDTGEMRLCFVPHDEVTFHDTWFSSGLRGTGERRLQPRGRRSCRSGARWLLARRTRHVEAPVARFPMFNVLAAGVASVCLGIAQRAVDEIVAACNRKGAGVLQQDAWRASRWRSTTSVAPRRSSTPLAPTCSASSPRRGTRCSAAIARASSVARASGRLLARRGGIRAGRVDIAYHLGGGSSVFASNPLQRCFRDIHTATQHMQVGRRIFESYGRLLMDWKWTRATL